MTISPKRSLYFGIALTFGVLIGFTNLFAPLHELFHVLASDGPARIIDWNHSVVDPTDFDAMVTAGWYGELIAFGLFTLIAIWAGRRIPLLTGGFPIGYMLITWIRGFGSADFSEGIASCVNSYTQYPQALRDAAIAAYADRVIITWAVMGLVFISLGLVLAIIGIKRKRPPK